MNDRYKLSVESAIKVREWIRDRGGAQVFQSINMSDLGRRMLSPVRDKDGKLNGKPCWSMADKPERILIREDECEVCFDREVKRFRVGIRWGAQGLTLKVTDAGTNKIRAAVEKAGGGAYYEFDYSTQEAIIMAPERTVFMEGWDDK